MALHDVATGRRRLIANFRGSNSAPAWSPDGRTLAVTLSRDGGSQLYLISANGGDGQAYGGWGGLYDSGQVTEAACWAHARRPWWDLYVEHGRDDSSLAAQALRRD